MNRGFSEDGSNLLTVIKLRPHSWNTPVIISGSTDLSASGLEAAAAHTGLVQDGWSDDWSEKTLRKKKNETE